MALTKKELLRLEELETQAKDNYVENSDYRAEDWLDTVEEKQEYTKLFNKFLGTLEEV